MSGRTRLALPHMAHWRVFDVAHSGWLTPNAAQKPSMPRSPSEKFIKDIRRATRRHYSAEDKTRIVLDGLRELTLEPDHSSGAGHLLKRLENAAQSRRGEIQKSTHLHRHLTACGVQQADRRGRGLKSFKNDP